MTEDLTEEQLRVVRDDYPMTRFSAMAREIQRRRADEKLRPMSEAPITGPVVEILVATKDRAGCNGWLIAHYAEGDGEYQPRFRGWFYWTGYSFDQIDSSKLLGWIPLPEIKP